MYISKRIPIVSTYVEWNGIPFVVPITNVYTHTYVCVCVMRI